ncbi:MAG: hypothetical protein CMH54_01955 [Myxococcales bacterium]|nr:hypothetical protein [Myxococcales bacterium]
MKSGFSKQSPHSHPTFFSRRISNTLTFGLAMLLFGSIMACSGANETTPSVDASSVQVEDTGLSPDILEPSFEHLALLASVSNNVISPLLGDFQVLTHDLHATAVVYADLVHNGETDTAEALADLQSSWSSTMDTWQELELLQIGPAAAVSEFVGGEGLRDEIYSWPSVNTCRVDQEIVENVFADDIFFEQNLVNVYGLDALEYLLFYHESDNTCSSLVKINSDGLWAALNDTEKAQRRVDYAVVLTESIKEHADQLLLLWTEADTGFTKQLSEAGLDTSVYETSQLAMDELFAALFTLDTVVKDKKMAIPLGISDSCSGDICVDELESRWAHYSKENIIANLKGFQRAFLGGAPPDGDWGFDDALVEAGAEALAQEIKEDVENALSVLEGMPDSFLEHLESADGQAQQAYEAVKKVTDHLKGDVPAVLKLEIPKEAAGDAD